LIDDIEIESFILEEIKKPENSLNSILRPVNEQMKVSNKNKRI